jgi:hypothetical protein
LIGLLRIRDCHEDTGDVGKVTELELCVFKQIAVAWHLASTGEIKDTNGVLIRKCEVLSVDVRVILKRTINGKDVRMLTNSV